MTPERDAALTAAMRKMPPAWRQRWCEPGPGGCGCLGCANAAGGLLRQGFTKAEWEEWRAKQLKEHYGDHS